MSLVITNNNTLLTATQEKNPIIIGVGTRDAGSLAIVVQDVEADAASASASAISAAASAATASAIVGSGNGLFPNGTVSLPSISFAGDTNTGIYRPSADTLAFVEGGAEAMRINSLGNVGIGNSSPTTRLQVSSGSSGATGVAGLNTLIVENSGGAGIAILTPNTDFGSIAFGDPENGAIGRIRYNHSTNDMTFNTNAAERMRITSAGLVGIGTTAPATNLEAVGTIRASGAAPILSILDSGGATDEKEWQIRGGDGPLVLFAINEAGGGSGDYLHFTRVGNSVRTIRGLRSGTTSYDLSNFDRSLMFSGGVSTIGTATAHDFVFESNDTERMRITSAGNVGIGTSSPAVPLEIGGQATLSLRLLTTTNAVDFRIQAVGSVSSTVLNNVSNHPLAIFTNNTERMRITSAGNVGIGTTAPDALLTVNGVASFGDGSAAAPSITNTGDLNTGIFFPAADTIAFAEGGVESMRLDASGNITQANAVSGSGAIVGEQTFRLAANVTAFGPAIGDFFGATSAISLEASSVYEIVIYAVFTKTTAGTATWTLTASSAPTRMIGSYQATPITGVGAGASTSGFAGSQGATTAAFAATGSLTTAVNHVYQFKVQVQTNLATSFKLQLTQGAGTATPLAGSYYTVKKISATTGTFV